MTVKCLAQEHSAFSGPGLKHGPLNMESSALTIRPLHFPLVVSMLSSD